MSNLKLMVKGDRFAALLAAADRGIPAVFVAENTGRGPASTLVVVSGAYEEAVEQWFREPAPCADGYGYPDGTLLFYGAGPDVPTVPCGLCHRPTAKATAHRHQSEWIGDCCWDDRLKASE